MSGQPADVAGLIAVGVLVLLAAALVLRRMLISRRGGVIVCALRLQPSAPWRQGLAEYRDDQLRWHRAMSLRLRPHAAFDRSDLVLLGTRPPSRDEDVVLGTGLVIASVRGILRHRGRPAGQRTIELAMSSSALMGLSSWLESSPVWPIRRACLAGD